MVVLVIDFEILGQVSDGTIIAVDSSIRELERLRRQYGYGRGRKLKGIATVQLIDGTIHMAEVHWYEAHGIGKKEFKLKLPLLD